MKLLTILLQLNTSIFLQNIGLVIIQAIFQAPIYGIAVYLGVKYAERKFNSNSKTENKN